MSKTRDALCFAGASEQARMVREHVVTAADLVEATLERIASVDATINAYRVVLGDQARADAERIDTTRADPDQTMLGVPVAIKDTIAVRGETTTWGTSANVTPAQADAPIVDALRRAGAIIIGKTTCSELAAWPVTETAAWGRTRNPWNTDHSPGGSSGGSAAAVAASAERPSAPTDSARSGRRLGSPASSDSSPSGDGSGTALGTGTDWR